MLKYANKLAVQELVKQASWWDSMKQTASDAWNNAKGVYTNANHAINNLYATAGNKLRAGWHGMTGNVQGVQDAQRAADQKWNAMKDHVVNAGKQGLSALGNTASLAAGATTVPGAIMHTIRGASMGGAKPAQSAAEQGITGYQAPPGGGLNAQYERDQETLRKMRQTPGLAEAPASAPVTAPTTTPAAAPKPAANTGGLTLPQMVGTGIGLPGNSSLTATQVNPNVGNPFAGSHTLGGMNPATVSTIMNSPSAAPAAPAPSGGGFDPSKITRAQMNKYRHITGARHMNSEMDKWKTYEAMNGRGRQATNAAFRRARAAGYR